MDYKTEMEGRVKEYLSFRYSNDLDNIIDAYFWDEDTPSIDEVVEEIYESEDFYNYLVDLNRETTVRDLKDNLKYLKYNLEGATKDTIDDAFNLKDYETVEYYIRQQIFIDYIKDTLYKEVSKLYRTSHKKVQESKNSSAWKYNNLLG